MANVITGATGTLGATVSKLLAGRGDNLILVGRSREKLEALRQTLPNARDHITVVRDLALPGNPSAYLPDIGNIDALINIAAEQGPIGRSWEIGDAAWEQTLTVNFHSVTRLCGWAVPRMSKGRRGKIVNVSGGGATGPRPNFSPYACAKTAVVRFTEILAKETADIPIDVNAVAPGQMFSQMTRDVIAAWAGQGNDKELDEALRLRNEPASGNEIKAAELIRYLVSPESDGITGRLISAVWDDLSRLREDTHDPNKFTLRRVV